MIAVLRSRVWLLWSLAAVLMVSSLRAEDLKSPDDSIKSAVAFLMSQQADDGGWHSETYGSMRQGAAVTSFVLYAMGHLPGEFVNDHREALQRGYEFLQIGLRKKGFVCNPDGTPDFPNYGSAMLLTAARRLKLEMPADDEKRLVDHLVTGQVSETREFKPDSPHYGGWDLMGALKVVGQTSGTNVSLGHFILEALAESNHPKLAKTKSRARTWTNGCQNFPGDGGFAFTPEAKFQSNKARLQKDPMDESRMIIRSYGTTTCDGLMCLIYSGADKNSERVRAAINWLANHPKVKVVPGFDDIKPSTGWEKGLRFYYYSSLVKALPLFSEKVAKSTRKKLAKQLVKEQRKDGSWKNASARMREDDPLICTSLAVIALAEIVKIESK